MAERSTIEFIVPPLTLLAALGLSLAPIVTAAHAPTGPHFILVVAAFWAQRRPGVTPALMLFPLLFVYELLRDGPLGIELVCALVIVETLAFFARRYPPYSIPDEWLRFAIATFAFELLVWLALAAAYVPTPSLAVLFTRWVGGLALYPVLILTLGRLWVGRRREDGDQIAGPGLFGRGGR